MTMDERRRKNNEFVGRFRTFKPRLRTPEYVAHQKHEGWEEPELYQPKGRGRGPSNRAKIASRVRFSAELKSVTTDRQLKVYALKVADQIISQRRKKSA